MLTITEALAEVKTLAARMEKKREAVMAHFARDGRLKDPLESDGGSVEFVRRERQALADLEERLIRIRAEIQKANHATSLTVEGRTRTVADWLTWRREVAPNATAFLNKMAGTIGALRQKMPGRLLVDSDAGATMNDVVVALNERELATEQEKQATVLGVLDGKLSLVNATTTVNVD